MEDRMYVIYDSFGYILCTVPYGNPSVMDIFDEGIEWYNAARMELVPSGMDEA
jgi:hypothetical protein